MPDQLYCLSDPAEPGLVRMTMRRGFSGRKDDAICKPGEQIDWALEVTNAQSALSALHKTMCRYRKNRGRGVYRCSSLDARAIAVRYLASHRNAASRWSLQQLCTRFFAISDRRTGLHTSKSAQGRGNSIA